MKKLISSVMFLLSLAFLFQCATGMQAPDPKVMACKSACDSAFNECLKKAGTSEAKKIACETAKSKCYSDCEKK